MTNDSQITQIFAKVEQTLIANGNLAKDARAAGRKEHKRLLSKFLTCNDNVFYRKLALIVFYSGFRASVVEQKSSTILKYFRNYRKVAEYSRTDVSRILSDRKMIRNESKIRALLYNAKVFKEIVSEYHSFRKFMLSFNPKFPLLIEGLDDLRTVLMRRLKYLGPATVNHYLTDFAFPVLKPDRMIMRVMHRAHLTKGEGKSEYKTAIAIGYRIAALNRLPMRYVDSVFVMLGQVGEANICRKTKPKCDICLLERTCHFYR